MPLKIDQAILPSFDPKLDPCVHGDQEIPRILNAKLTLSLLTFLAICSEISRKLAIEKKYDPCIIYQNAGLKKGYSFT